MDDVCDIDVMGHCAGIENFESPIDSDAQRPPLENAPRRQLDTNGATDGRQILAIRLVEFIRLADRDTRIEKVIEGRHEFDKDVVTVDVPKFAQTCCSVRGPADVQTESDDDVLRNGDLDVIDDAVMPRRRRRGKDSRQLPRSDDDVIWPFQRHVDVER
ncbi:MAG: hypothetical protein RLZ37_563 [Actinomycetota bacterium]